MRALLIKSILVVSALFPVLANAEVVTTTSAVVPVPATTQVVVERPVIVTAVPAPKETIVTPSGYISCFSVKAGWYQDVWVAEHRVCQYPNTANGVAWVEGYWACTKYSVDAGQCTNWEWKPARWEKALVVY